MTSDDDDDVAHNSLVAAVKKIYSDDRKKTKRAQVKNVRVTSESEIPSYKLGNILSKIGGGSKLKKKLEPLIEPLDKLKAKRLQREAGFETVAIEANKWDAIVDERKKADQLHFPLEKVDLRVITSEKNYKPSMQTDLEKEVYGLLHGAELDVQAKPETEEDETIKKAMSLKEIRERSRQIMKDRNLKIRLERKAALLNKSKSRKYHKILRRERLKRKKQEFETMKETNPEAAIEVLNEIERTRVKERMDLRHKNSKWLRVQQTRAPHDDQIRDLLKENKEMRQELLEKLKFQQQSDGENSEPDGDDHDDDGNQNLIDIMKDQAQSIKEGKFDSRNMWVSQLAVPNSADSKPDESFYKMKKYWEDRNEEKLRELEALKVVKEYEEKQKRTEHEEEEGKTNKDETQKYNSKLKASKDKKNEIEKQENTKIKVQKLKKKENKKKSEEKKLNKTTENKTKNTNVDKQTNINKMKNKTNKNKIQIKEIKCNNSNKEEKIENNKNSVKNKSKNNAIENNIKEKIDSDQEEANNNNQSLIHFNTIVDRKLGSARPDYNYLRNKLNNDESDSDEKEDFEDIFADDEDFVKEFEEEKRTHEESTKLKDIDNFKEGWGNWGGPGIVHSEKRKKKFRIKAPKAPLNKYSKVGNVIYNEKGDVHENLRKNMVSELPFPFVSVKDFEASIRQPIGRTFVPELSHKKLIAPSIVQKMGTVIEPMGEECLIKNHEEHKRKESALDKKLSEKLRGLQGNKKRKTVAETVEMKRRRDNKKKKKNRSKAKPLILI